MKRRNVLKKLVLVLLSLALLLTTAISPAFLSRPANADSSFTLPPLTGLGNAAYGNGIYVVTGDYAVNNNYPLNDNSVILTSPDGATWTVQPIINNMGISDLVYGNSLFVAVGGTPGKGTVLTSDDGIHWSTNNFDDEFNSIIYGNDRYLLLGSDDNYTSTDGVNWTTDPNRVPFDGHVIFGNGIFVDFKVDGTQFATSQDGVNWQTRDMGLIDYKNPFSPTIRIMGAVYGDGMYVVTGELNTINSDPMGGTQPIVVTSPDASTWTMTKLPHPYSPDEINCLADITFGNGIFMATDSNNDIRTSPDGLTWTLRDTGAKGFYDFIGAANGDTITWWDPGVETKYGTVSFCGNQFVALSESSGTISTSLDGVDWTNRQTTPATFPAQTPVIFVVNQGVFYVGTVSYGDGFYMDATPYIDESGRTLIPVRYLSAVLGAQTNWDANTRTITVTNGNKTTISMVIGSKTLIVNGQTQMMDTTPAITAGRTYLPARYVAEALGFTVLWNARTQTITVSQNS